MQICSRKIQHWNCLSICVIGLLLNFQKELMDPLLPSVQTPSISVMSAHPEAIQPHNKSWNMLVHEVQFPHWGHKEKTKQRGDGFYLDSVFWWWDFTSVSSLFMLPASDPLFRLDGFEFSLDFYFRLLCFTLSALLLSLASFFMLGDIYKIMFCFTLGNFIQPKLTVISRKDRNKLVCVSK